MRGLGECQACEKKALVEQDPKKQDWGFCGNCSRYIGKLVGQTALPGWFDIFQRIRDLNIKIESMRRTRKRSQTS